jgi:hypothetical protein
MPRATNKKQFLDDAQQALAKLNNFLETLTPQEWEMDGIVGEWSVKDVLAHLAEWHQMGLGWYRAGLRGETPAVPAPGYTWRALPALNQHIYEKHHHRPLEEIRDWFYASDREATQTVESLSEEDLFTRGLYSWMNNNALAAYFTANLSSHYTWALKEIKRGINQKRKTK